MNFQILNCHDGAPSGHVYSIKLEILRGALRLKLDAPFFDDPLPPPLDADVSGGEASKRYPGLYRFECVEIFIAAGDRGDPASTHYLELEVGPGGNYYAISFSGEQKWSSQDDELLLDEDPEVVIDRKEKRWRCKGSLPFFLLPEPAIDPTDPLKLWWHINCTAIHGTRNRQYLSQNVMPGEAPNFHQLSFFSPFALSDLDSQRLRSMSASMSASNRSYSLPLALRAPSNESCARGSVPPRPTETIDETLERIRLCNASAGSSETFASLVRPHLLAGEGVLLCCKLRKRKGWSHRTRLLALTSKPRLVYFSSNPPYAIKGSMEWGMQLPLEVQRVSPTALDLLLHDGSRTFHWFDDWERGDALDKLANSINDIQQAWEAYMRCNFGYANSPFVRVGGPGASHTAPTSPPMCLLL